MQSCRSAGSFSRRVLGVRVVPSLLRYLLPSLYQQSINCTNHSATEKLKQKLTLDVEGSFVYDSACMYDMRHTYEDRSSALSLGLSSVLISLITITANVIIELRSPNLKWALKALRALKSAESMRMQMLQGHNAQPRARMKWHVK